MSRWFLKSSSGKRWEPEFRDEQGRPLKPATPEFSAKWQEIARRDPVLPPCVLVGGRRVLVDPHEWADVRTANGGQPEEDHRDAGTVRESVRQRPDRGHAVSYHRLACYSLGVLKLLLISVLLATFVIPAAAASGKKPGQALRVTLLSILLAELAYAFFLRFVYERLM